MACAGVRAAGSPSLLWVAESAKTGATSINGDLRRLANRPLHVFNGLQVQEQAGSQADALKFVVFYAPENAGVI
jgi:hypothetical protein